jgi:hypothetical protein
VELLDDGYTVERVDTRKKMFATEKGLEIL